MRQLLGLLLLCASCQRAGTEPARGGRIVTFKGTCDASSAVELDRRRMLVSDDENNVLRVYDVERGGFPELEIDISSSLGLEEPDEAESDLEASTRRGERGYFLSSHARTKRGERDPDRLLFFAARVPPTSGSLEVFGTSRSLLDQLLAEPSMAELGLRAAAELPPKKPGGLNLEGLTTRSDGGVWLGFRSPVPRGRALLVGLLNPDEVLEGRKARFSPPLLLDLGALGVRALSFWRSATLILAGPSGEGGPFKLFRLGAEGKVEAVAADLTGISAEAMFADDSREDVLILSDDGTREVFGEPCKKLDDPAQKSFRGVWVRVPP